MKRTDFPLPCHKDLDRIRAQGSRATAKDDPKWHHDDDDEQEATIIAPETSPKSETEDGERDVDDDHHHQSSTAATPRAFKRIFAIDHLSDAEEIVQVQKGPRAGSIQDVMYALLSDIVSVDTQIILTMENALGMISLDVWTHRKVISRYAMFSCLIKNAVKECARRSSATPSAAGSMTNILTLKVYHVSLLAMCTLLEFVYLGRIERSINLNLVALRMSEYRAAMAIAATATATCITDDNQDKESFMWWYLDVASWRSRKEVSRKEVS